MTDWRGSTIKAGDTIVFVNTRSFLTNFGIMIPNGNGQFEFHKSKVQPPDHCWEPREYQTKEFEGELFYTSMEIPTDGITRWMVLDDFTIKFWLSPSTIICIKGKSDSEEEYYKEFFKA